MKSKVKPDTQKLVPPTLEEVIAEVKKHIPTQEPDGRFCRGDLMRHAGLSEQEAHNQIRRWRAQGLIEPAGKVRRENPWGDTYSGHAYRLVEDEKDISKTT